MKVFVCRHGNTFGSDQEGGQRIFMSGSKNNIPLVETGRQQARLMAQYLDSINVIPSALYANHLIRIWEYAVIIKEYFYNKHHVNIPLYKDEHLLELDYGTWAGLTSSGNDANENQVIAKFGKQAWDDWQEKRIIPNYPPHNWQITQDEIVNNIHLFFANLLEKHNENDIIVPIGSQGSITFINSLFAGGMEKAISDNHYKIKTGHFAEIEYNLDKWQLISWNVNPKPLITT